MNQTVLPLLINYQRSLTGNTRDGCWYRSPAKHNASCSPEHSCTLKGKDISLLVNKAFCTLYLLADQGCKRTHLARCKNVFVLTCAQKAKVPASDNAVILAASMLYLDDLELRKGKFLITMCPEAFQLDT